MLQVEFIWNGKKDEGVLPIRKTDLSSGLDLKAYIDKRVVLKPGTRALIDTGWSVIIPKGYEAQVRSRSGMAYKYGIFVLNSPGTIDRDYTGNIKVLLQNASQEEFIVLNGMAIAQLVIAPVAIVDPIDVRTGVLFDADITSSSRGDGGFGSTGDY
jgi:dUTP pyrophosphatase